MARYVKTAVARNAVKGREAEIIQKSGVDWKPGQRGHITCPYKDHGGSGDWRLDEAKGLCFCSSSCMPKPSSVFDHLSRMRGDDPQAEDAFEQSKIEAMELIDRTDLIEGADKAAGKRKERQKKPWHDYFKTNAMLNPPADLRDDNLVRTYLAARQGVAPEDAALPSSPCVGLKRLDFPHACEGKAAVECPCVVFFMVNPNDPDQVTGGIRVYLNEDGTAKADLRQPDGTPHKVKPMTTGSKHGGAVLYGNPAAAKKQAVCEGVETGGSIALGARHRDDADVLVACGGTAESMKNIPIVSTAERLFIACDRDERPSDKGNVSKTGEIAGIHIAAKHADRLPVHLALPRAPGCKADWNDVQLEDGPDAVYDGVFNAPQYNGGANQQSDADTAVPPSEPAIAKDLGSILKLYPLPDMHTEELSYDDPKGNGDWWMHRKKAKKNADDEWEETHVPICTPFAVTHRVIPLDGGTGPDYHLRLAIQGMTGHLHAVNVPRAIIGKPGSADIKAVLFRAGLRTEGDGDSVAVNILKAANPTRQIKVASRPGWHRLGGTAAPIFVAPTGQVIGNTEGQDIELDESVKIAEPLAKAGTFEEWKRITKVIAGIDNVNHWRISLCASFAGVLVDLLQMSTMGICFTGMTTRGKSTAQRIATAAWSNPDEQNETLNHSALTTLNAVEAKAQKSNGSILGLDDLKNLKGSDVASLVYKLAGGVGKGRMKSDASMRPSMKWNTFVLMSIEKTLQQAIEEDGGEWLPGVSVRIPDVNVTSVSEKVPDHFMDDVRKIELNYGHAATEFVRCLVESGQHEDRDKIRQSIATYARELADTENGETIRAATPFATVWCAGVMAKAFGILPNELNVKDAIAWGWKLFQHGSEVGHNRQEDAIGVLRDWLAANWNVKVVHTSVSHPRIAPEAWYDDEYVYINGKCLSNIIPNTIRVIDFAEQLKKEGILVPDAKAGKNSHTKARTGSKKIGSCYWLNRPEIGQPIDADENMNEAYEEAKAAGDKEALKKLEENVVHLRSGRR